jgi:glucose/arabinose dehydrogenase
VTSGAKIPAFAVVIALTVACTPETKGVLVPSPTAGPATQASATSMPAATPMAERYELVEALPEARFERMVGFSTIPGASNEAAVITQHKGQIWKVFLDGEAPELMGDISGLLAHGLANEEGLLGLAFSPRFQFDHRLYLYYTADDGCPSGFSRCSVISRFQVAGGAVDTDSEKVLLKVGQPETNHNGGDLAFGPDGYLYVGLGDGGGAGDPHENGQDLSTLLGSILRLDVSGSGYAVPLDNPFVGTPDVRPEIHAYGLRNPWRFSFDRETGDLWAGDVGQDRWEEVDRIVSGGNYGWNVMEAFECFRSSTCEGSELELPRVAYGHALGCSVSGGHVYRGPSMPELDGWYVYGDFCSGRVWAANTADDSAPVLLVNSGRPIAAFGEMPDGELLALAFDNVIYRLQRR